MVAYKTPFGPVQYSQVSVMARHNSAALPIDSKPRFTKRHGPAKLQRAALEALREAERRYGKRTLNPKRPRKLRPSRTIVLTGTWRSYDLQAALYAKDSHRYASPNVSGHVQGIAIDVSTAQPNYDLIRSILADVGWNQSRPDDESWHHALGAVV